MADSAAAAPSAHEAVPSGSPGDRGATVASVTKSFVGLQRTVRRSKARLHAAAGDDVESATHVLLHVVAAEGPMRASALASSVHADLSTVSRQVAALVSRGLLERQADQLDGRASLLAVTDTGRAAIAEHERGRQAFFDEVLTGWTTQEMRQFAQQLERFTAAYDRIHTAWMDERVAGPQPPAEAKPEEGPHA
jgi:DNA-binding MarR family transcriptional regulator